MNDQKTKALGERDKRQSSEVELDQKTHTHRKSKTKHLWNLWTRRNFVFLCVERSIDPNVSLSKTIIFGGGGRKFREFRGSEGGSGLICKIPQRWTKFNVEKRRETGGISKSVFISRVRRNKQKQTSLTQSYQRGKQIYSWSLSRLYLRGGCNEIVFQFFRTFRFRSFWRLEKK